MYRPEIKVMDCTIRDGGLMNNWEFPREMVHDVFHKLAAAGVDYVELGYRVDKKMFPPEKHGAWRFCDEEDVREVATACDTKISVMCDVGRTDYDAFLPRNESIINTFRVATYVKDVDKAIHLINHIKGLGYEVTCNIMAVSTELEINLDEALEQLADCPVDVVYLVDSFGYFYSEQIHYLAAKYREKLRGKELGIHCHNNQQLAFANTVEGIVKGINWVDGSIYGMGRAAGLGAAIGVSTGAAPAAALEPLYNVVIASVADLQALQDSGNRADPAALAGGIWQALLTTAAGMAVAIPASMALSWFDSVTDRLQAEMEDLATRIFVARQAAPQARP